MNQHKKFLQPYGGISRGRGRPMYSPRIQTGGQSPPSHTNDFKEASKQSITTENSSDGPSICMEKFFKNTSELSKKLSIELDLTPLAPMFDPVASNHFDLSDINQEFLKFDFTAANINVHDIFVKGIPNFEQGDILFRKAVQHHAAIYSLGHITWVKLQQQPKSLSTTIGFIRFENRALHPQIVRSLEGARWRNHHIVFELNRRKTKPAHFYKTPMSRYALENKLEDRELSLKHKKEELDSQEQELNEREAAFRMYSGSKPEDKEKISELEKEVYNLRQINHQLQNREDSTQLEWNYIDQVRGQLQKKLESQCIREKNIRENKRAIRIREAQLDFNEVHFNRRLREEVETRVEARINNRPEPNAPTLDPVFVVKNQVPVRKLDKEWDKEIKQGWDRFIDEKLKCKFELLAVAAQASKQDFIPEQSFIFELIESKCKICSQRLVHLKKEDVYVTQCGHMYCQDCIFRACVELPECPTCDKSVNLEEISQLFTEA